MSVDTRDELFFSSIDNNNRNSNETRVSRMQVQVVN